MTVGAVLALHEMRIRIPDDISFVGFDHFEAIDVIEPPLTVVEQPIQKIGEIAARLLLKRVQGDYHDFPETIKLNTKMVIRGSVRTL